MAEHAVLIAGGIGVTPFAAILESLWFRHQLNVISCPTCAAEVDLLLDLGESQAQAPDCVADEGALWPLGHMGRQRSVYQAGKHTGAASASAAQPSLTLTSRRAKRSARTCCTVLRRRWAACAR
jgi:hypothetical protein